MNKHPNGRFRKTHSIFVKLLLVLLGTAVLVHLFVGTFFGIVIRPLSKSEMENNVRNYATYLVREMGVPPDTLKAREIEKLLNVQIRFESPTRIWATSNALPPIQKVRNRQFKSPVGRFCLSRQYCIVANPDGSEFLFKGDFGKPSRPFRHLLITLLSVLTLVFLGSYFFLRRILRPIRMLTTGAAEIAGGNLNIRIPVQSTDELQHLTRAFNDMARRVREMIHARDQLLLDVSHELRSPLTRIKVALEMIPESGKKKSILSDILELETMISEILESEKMKNGHGKLNLRRTDMAGLIATVVRQFRNQSPAVEFSPPSGKSYLSVDADRVRTVLKNVIENAIKYSGPANRPVEVSVQEETQVFRISFKDGGSGIPESELASVFEPFYRVERSRSRERGGYGLGLSLCKKIMDAHSGKIEIFNNADKGVTVVLTFPKQKARSGNPRG